MTTFQLITLNCPVCQTQFHSTFITSCGFASRRTDFRPNYWGMNPVRNFYHYCPLCGFCSVMNFFKGKFINLNFIKKIKKLGPLKEKNIVKILERKTICLEIMNEFKIIKDDPRVIIESWLEVFWWSECNQDIKKYGSIVLNQLKSLLSKNILGEKQKFIFKYLTGEINRRIGNPNKAKKIFQEILRTLKVKDENNPIYSLAQQQHDNPKENLEIEGIIELY